MPGGIVEFARAVGVRPAPDRGRFLFDLTRVLYGSDIKPQIVPAVLQSLARLKPRAPDSTGDGPATDDGGGGRTFDDDLVPVPLTAELWSSTVFHRQVSRDDLVTAIVSDRQAALLCHGLLAMDDETLRFFADHRSLIGHLLERSVPVFAAFSSSVRVSGGRVVPPGGESRPDVVAMWEAAVGEKVTRPERFISQLFDASEGRLAYLYDTLGQIDPPRRAFALGLWIENPAVRAERFKALASDGVAAFREWHLRSLPFGRAGWGLAMVLSRVEVGPDGAPAEPSSRGFWARAFGHDAADDPRPMSIADDAPFDAAWLTETIGSVEVRQRADRLDQMAFANRIFREAARPGRPERGDALIAVRGLPRYRMLMLTLERVGIRDASVFAAAARHASRIPATSDGHRAFVANGQYQGALALVARAVRARTIDVARAQKLIELLVAIPIGEDGRYNGAVARWMREDFLPATPADAGDIEHRVIAAMAGPAWRDAQDSRPLTWEGQRYRLDLGAAERIRLNKVRERQLALPFDVAMTIADAGRTLRSEGASTGQANEIVARLTQLLAEVRKRSRDEEADAAPPGAGISRDQHDTLQRSIGEITRAIRQNDLKRLAKLAEPLVDLGDDMLASALVSFAYAADIGDPDGAILLADDVSQRHDFGLAVHDSDQRLKTAWAMPKQDALPGAAWHVSGSILGLDVALAPLALRRISADPIVEAPALTSIERESFAASVSLMNPFDLRDADRDAIASAVENGRAAVAAFDAERLEAAADRLGLEMWRRRSLRWTLARERDRLPSMFTLAELLVIGGGRLEDLAPWGMSMIAVNGCLCTAVHIPSRLVTLGSRPQLGLTSTVVADLNLHVAMMLKELQLPAALARLVATAAMQDFIDHVRPADDGDWMTLARVARTIPRDRIEDYLAVATAVGPLVPDNSR